MDPTEFGSCLSGLRCRDCGNKGQDKIEKEGNIPMLLPIDPTNSKSDLICSICNSTMPSERVYSVYFLSTLNGVSNILTCNCYRLVCTIFSIFIYDVSGKNGARYCSQVCWSRKR